MRHVVTRLHGLLQIQFECHIKSITKDGLQAMLFSAGRPEKWERILFYENVEDLETTENPGKYGVAL